MRMSVLIVAGLILLGSCATSNIIDSWNEPDLDPVHFDKLAILVMSPNLSTRTVSEYAIFDVFKEKYKVIPTFDIFPFAGQIEELTKDKSETEVEKMIQRKMDEHKIDGIMIISVLSRQENQRYVPGSSFSVSVPDVAYSPVYGQPYYSYFSGVTATVFDSGYYTSYSTYFIESNLYDTQTGHLIYTAQSKIEDPQSIGKESEAFGKSLYYDIVKRGILK
jgi:hypothetical protein